MNAKKIMGAVLVALLAAALLVGAGAAADPDDIGTLYTYTQLPTSLGTTAPVTVVAGLEFKAEDGTAVVVVNDGSANYFAVTGDALGKQYTGNGITFKLVAPTVAISAIIDATKTSFIGSTVDDETINDPSKVSITVAATNGFGATDADIVAINEAGVAKPLSQTTFTAGKWGLAVAIPTGTGVGKLVVSNPVVGDIYYFTVSDSTYSISAVKDVVYEGSTIIVTVAAPGNSVVVKYDKDDVTYITDQAGSTPTGTAGKVTVNIGLDGTGKVAFTAKDEGKTTFAIDVVGVDAEVDVTIEEGYITAVADEEYFYLGNPITLSGTATVTEQLYYYIEGTNFDFMSLTTSDYELSNGEWTAEIASTFTNPAGSKKLVAGTYTVVVSTEDPASFSGSGFTTMKEYAMNGLYGTAAVTMTQPFITDVEAAAVAVQGKDYKIKGTAIAAGNVTLYVFGTSFFAAQTEETDEDDVFEFTITGTADMAPGTYFYLIQHPMNDKVFNVWNGTQTDVGKYAKVSSGAEADFFYAATGNTAPASFIFNAWTRGTNFAAQALLDEISGQNIDDIFVQGTFEVEAQKLVINPIPAEVAKGTKLAITGSTNSGDGVEVIVNVLAGKFGATVKGDENAATFLTAKAITQKDGTFEAAIDTSKLPVGAYIVTVELDGKMYDSAAVEIVDKAPVTPPADDKPDTPVTPPADDKPTEPETPGFGALAALAGLGAVAVLLLRRE